MLNKFEFVKATKTTKKARIGISGPSGSGKTYSALIAASALKTDAEKIAVIDTERGSASLYAHKFAFDVLELPDYDPFTYVAAIQAAEKAGYGVIIIDSLTHAWQGEGGALDKHDSAQRQQKTRNSYTAWASIKPEIRRLIDTILNSQAHIIVTIRSSTEYVQEKDSNNRTTVRKVGMSPIFQKDIDYEFDVFFDLDVEHFLTVSKTRLDGIPISYKMPDIAYFKKIMEAITSDAVAPKPIEIKKTEEQPLFHKVELPGDPVVKTMTLYEANEVTTSAGVRFGTLDEKILTGFNSAIAEQLKNDPDNEELQKKLMAVRTILTNRKGG